MTDPQSNIEPSPRLPSQIGDYRIERELGSGGMGTVYLGIHQGTGQPAAVKVLPASMAREEGFVARFGREIAAMQQLKSSHIVELYESGESEGTYYYAMEFVDGETLTDRLRRVRRIPWREAIEIAVQVCRALKAAHNCGIVHRDLKPSNLLIGHDGTVKLTDFGIAQVFASSKLTVTGGILGTAEYMSPEQAQGQRATRQSDLYSLGAVLYVMLTGRPPFVGKTTMEVLQKHRFSQFDSPRQIVPDIPHWLDEVVRKCLEKKPEDRYPDAYVLMLRLEEIPRKIDFKAAAEEEPDPDSETLAATVAAPEKLRIGGTLVRDLFRAEAEAQARSDGWLRIFDNLWVLIGVLLLCLVGAWAAWRGTHLSPETRFERGVALMEQPEGTAWEEAQEKYFNPLLQLDADTWEPRVAPYLSRIQLYTLKRQLLGRGLARDPLPRSEPEAVFRQALELRRLGRLAEAEQKISALNVLIAENPDLQPLQSPVARLREELVKEQLARRFDYLRSALQRAEDLQQAGQVSEAQAIWRSVLELYDSDPDAIEWTTQARNSLQSAVPAAPSSRLPAESR